MTGPDSLGGGHYWTPPPKASAVPEQVKGLSLGLGQLPWMAQMQCAKV